MNEIHLDNLCITFDILHFEFLNRLKPQLYAYKFLEFTFIIDGFLKNRTALVPFSTFCFTLTCFWKQAKFFNLWFGKQISLEEPASLQGDVVALQWQVPYLRIVQVFVVVTSVVNASWLSCVSNMTTIITTTTTITGNNSTTGQSRQLRLYDCHHNFHFHYWDIYRLSDFYEHYTPPTRERAPIV